MAGRHVFSLLVLLVLAVGVVGPRCAATTDGTTPTSVAEIVAAYQQACGGPVLGAIRSEIRKGTLLRGKTGKVPVEIVAKVPGKWRYHQVFAWGDQVVFGCDGEEAWVQDTRGIDGMSSRQRLDLELLLDVRAPLELSELYPTMTVEGAEKVGDREATTVVATSAEGTATELAFDRETGLLLRAGEIFFEDYREVGGVTRPFRVLLGTTQGEEHLQMKMEISEIRHDLDVDDSLFVRPTCVLSVTEPPLHTARQEVEVDLAALEACVGVYRQSPEVLWTVTRQGDHLMIRRSGMARSFEIKPASELDYFIRFLDREFHFVRDESGRVTRLELGADRAVTAERVDEPQTEEEG